MTSPIGGDADERERLIRELLARRGVASVRRPTAIARRAPGTPIPLSPLQEGMWFIDRLDPGSPLYVMAVAMRLIGPVDSAAMQASVDALVARHEALRTAIVARDGRPEQVVLAADDPAARAVVVLDDVSDRPAADREKHARELARLNGETGFDLGRAPLLRVRLIRLGDDDHMLAVSLHHIIGDERSLHLVLGEILDGHQRIRTGGRQSLPPATQFPDYVLWQRARLAERADEHRRFWADRLAGTSGVLDLPTDRPRPAVQTFNGASAGFPVAPQLAAALDELARRTGCTRFMIVLTALKMVLHRWSGQEDICVGSPVSTRSTPELQSVIGLLVNSLPLRTDLSGDPTVEEVLQRVRQTCVDSLDHVDLPLDEVVKLARAPRDPSRNPLFQVMCAVNSVGDVRKSSGLSVTPVGFGRETARLDLTLMFYEDGPDLSAVVDYNTDLFDAATIARFGDWVRQALRALTTSPGQRLSELDLRGEAERHELAGWQATGRDYPVAGLPDLVRARAVATPEAPAVIDGDTVLSYGELDRRSGLLARRLRAAGVGPDLPVGLALPASPAALVGLLGILRAGGAYLPLDPSHPGPRLVGLLTDAAAPLTITVAAHADRFADYPGTLLVLDESGLPADGHVPPDGTAEPVCHPDQLAYVIYTSGSTGTPKGVMVSHRTAVNLAHAFVDLHGIRPGDRLLMLPPLSFDASVGDVFPALISGAALVLHRRPAELTGPDLLRLCARQGITMVDTAAPLWVRWAADLVGPPPALDHPLRVVMVGGEAAPVTAVRDWSRATGGRVRVYNHYGPTEATVCATSYDTVDASELPGLHHLPIGRPLPNVRVHLLDARMRPVPVGAVGEVYIGGTAPARGYLGAPGLTAQRFVPDPFGPPGSRLYRTGDLARHRSDGTLEFLGRTDRQVKIRGHRIEVGEVEAACADQPGVARAAVTVRDDGHGPRLVAYLVPAGDPAPVPAQVRAALRQRLPEYMVPAHVVVLPELPLNAHGKIDLAALPAPQSDGAEHVPPRTDTERALADIWAKMLDTGPVGALDNFFDLGGHSLLAGPLAARIADRFGITLPLRALFETPDLAGMADLIDEQSRPATDRSAAERRLADTVRADAQLPDDVCADLPAGSPAAVPEAVLVTGATGFLGAHLVADWLTNSEARLHCLVRAASPAAALDRIRANLQRYGLWQDRYAARIVGLPGDLGEPKLGLSRRDFDALADTVDAVVHNGGLVNFLLPYEKLRPANVAGTIEVLRLAGSGRPSAVHMVSTLGVFLNPGRDGVVTEHDAPDDCTGLGDGYNSSKWTADALARAARERGLPVSVYRPARITGHSVTGVGNADDFFSRLIKTFVQLGAVPHALNGDADMSPIDYVAGGIGHLSRQPERWGQDFHFYNNHTISYPDLAKALESYGYPVACLPYGQWRAMLLERTDAALTPFLGLFGPPAAPEQRRLLVRPRFDCTTTETVLADGGIVCPPADAALVHTYLEWFVRVGFVDPPPSTPSVIDAASGSIRV